jgi:hypothetical protein
MRLTLRLEMDECGPQSGAEASVVIATDNFQQRGLPCRISANFVTQVAATFLGLPQTCARRRADLRVGTRIYDEAVAPKLNPAGAAVYRKT